MHSFSVLVGKQRGGQTVSWHEEFKHLVESVDLFFNVSARLHGVGNCGDESDHQEIADKAEVLRSCVLLEHQREDVGEGQNAEGAESIDQET